MSRSNPINPQSIALHGDFVRRLSRVLVHDADDAEDVSQEVWKRALESRVPVRDLRSWLGGIVRHVSRQRRSSDSALARRERASANPERTASVEDAMIRVEEIRMVIDALETLPAISRDVLLRRFYQDSPPREIARELSLSVETVKSRQKRALEQLRKKLDERWNGDRNGWKHALLPLIAVRKPFFTPMALSGLIGLSLTAAGLVLTTALLWWPTSDIENASPSTSNIEGASDIEGTGPVVDSELSTRESREFLNPLDSPLPSSVSTPPPSSRTLQVVDQETERAVPHFALSQGGRILTTDREGFLQLPDSLPLELALLDDAQVTTPRETTVLSSWGALSVDVGPTFFFDWISPPTPFPHELTARLEAAAPSLAAESSFARVREGSGPWVRFPPEAEHLKGGPPFRLEVRSEDGFFIGDTEIQSVRSDRDQRCAITFRRCGALRGSVTTAEGVGIDGARVRVIPLSDAEESRETATDNQGRYRLRWLSPGPYTVHVTTPLHVEYREIVLVHELQTAICPVRLQTDIDLVRFEGVLRFDPALPLTKTFILLASEEPPMRVFSIEVDSEGMVEGVARRRKVPFTFDGVPSGDYSVTVHTEDFLQWDPVAPRLTLPAEPLTFERQEDVPHDDFEIRIAPSHLDTFDVFIEAGPRHAAHSKVQRGEGRKHLLQRVPKQVPLRWIVRARGYKTYEGTRHDFVQGSVLCTLEPGWRNVFHLRDSDGHPVAGVSLLLDGAPTEPSDDEGRIVAEAEDRPSRMSLADPSWRLVGGDISDSSDEKGFQDLLWGVQVILSESDSPSPPSIPNDNDNDK